MEKVNILGGHQYQHYILTLTHLFDDNSGDHSEKGSSCTSNVVEESPPQLAAQSEDEQTSSDEDTDSGDEEKLEEELIFMDLVSMHIVDLC